MAVEQLLYTWAAQGMEGLGRFQVVASTPRLAKPSKARSIALELCIYERPSAPVDEPPVSFGWLTRGRTRIAFRRKETGRDGVGRPGNFAAHILIGTREELPPDQLCASFASDCWWDGSMGDLAVGKPLTPLDVFRWGDADLPVPTAATRDVVAALLGRTDQRLTLPLGPAELACALRYAAATLPGIVDDLSVSTYEGERLATVFDVLGQPLQPRFGLSAPTAAVPRSVGHSTARAASFVVRQDPAAQGMVSRLWEAADFQGAARLVWFTTRAATHEVLLGGDEPSAEELVRLIFDPEVASEVLRMPRSRSIAARAFVNRDASMVEVICRVFAALDGDVQESLGADIAMAAVPLGSLELDAIALLAERLPARVTVQLTAALLRETETPGTTLEMWPLRLVECALSGDVDPPSDLRRRLIQRAAPHAALLADSAIPDQTYAAIVSAGLDAGHLERQLSQAVVHYDYRLPTVYRALGPRRFADLLSRSDARQVVAVLGRGSRLRDADALEPVVREGLSRSDPASAVQIAADLRSRVQMGSAVWAELALGVYRDFIAQMLGDTRVAVDFDALHRLGSGLADVRVAAWCHLFRAVHRDWRLDRREQAIAQIPPDEAATAARFALDAGIATSSVAPGLAADHLWRVGRLVGLDMTAVALSALNGAQRGLDAYRSPVPVETALYCVAALFEGGLLQRTFFTKRSAGAGIDERAAQLMADVEWFVDVPSMMARVSSCFTGDGLGWLRRLGVPKRARGSR
jgi:hypothetical protein